MKQKNQKVCVVGQGYVGLPMSIAISNSKNKNGKLNFSVIGLEKNNKRGFYLKNKVSSGILPISTGDKKIYKMFKKSQKNKNFYITNNIAEIKKCKIIIVSINFEINHKKNNPFNSLKSFFKDFSKFIKKNTLIIVETTLPPGTSDKIIYPILLSETKKRGFSNKEIMLSYSYERIMPGYNYYDSIVNNYRVFSGVDNRSKNKCQKFLEKIINVKKYPLHLLNSNTECEFSKILENSYRATNIAFIDEWTKYSSTAKVDMYNVLQAIKKRHTHSNIMRPGLGVGGYCLTKDPYFAAASAKTIFKKRNNFPFINLTMKTNKNMPNTSLDYIKKKVKTIKNKKVLILGLSYREGVGDYRSSPSLMLIKKLKSLGADINVEDPMIHNFNQRELKKINNKKYEIKKYDVVIFCTPHKIYNKIKFNKFSKKTIFFDLNNIISEKNKKIFKKRKIKIFTLGKN